MDLGPLVEDRRKDFTRERVCSSLTSRLLLLTNGMLAQMARGENPDQLGIVAQLQCSSEGRWSTGTAASLSRAVKYLTL